MHALPLLFAFGMGASCKPENVIHNQNQQDDEDAAPLLVLDPQEWDFGGYPAGEGDSITISIENQGNKALDITGYGLEGDDGFALLTTGMDTELAPGEGTEISISFTAQSLDHEARLVLETTDPEAERVAVELRGHGLIPALFVTPSPYDMGKVEPFCLREGGITLMNVGRDTLLIESLAPVGEAFEFDLEGIELPLALEPDEYIEVPVGFMPEDLTTYEGEFWVDSNAQDEVVLMSGEGVEDAGGLVEYQQPISGQVDIMFYVDQSCSMEDDKVAMTAKFEDFIDELEDLDADYLIMGVNADSGCHAIDYIEPDTENKLDVFSQAVNAPGGIYTEAGLTIGKHAVGKTDSGECNSRFLREQSTVSLILISDEPEQSPPNNHPLTIAGEILAAAPSTYISAVAGPLPAGCESGGQSADAGLGYYEATVMTGGIFLSICDLDWGEKLAMLAEQATIVKLADTFYLPEEDIQEDTVLVFVDGEQVTEGWSYEDIDEDPDDALVADTLPTVTFDADSVPGEGSSIRIEYGTAVVCD